MQITMEKAEVLKRLKDNLALAKMEDQRAKKAHEADESQLLASFRKKLKDALAWDYKRAKKNDFGVELPYGERKLTCPSLQQTHIAHVLEMVQADRKDVYQIYDTDNSGMFTAVFWKPESQRPKKSVCDD